MDSEKILVTGCAGFIGMHLCESLLKDNIIIAGLDNLNDYYSQNLKLNRLERLKRFKHFKFYQIDILEQDKLFKVIKKFNPTILVHLAAQAGVRYSIDNPFQSMNINVLGFTNILEGCRSFNIKKLIYASSSSVYGQNSKYPFSEKEKAIKPISLYGVSKKTNEMIAFSYSELHKINTIGLRFFTVYGPWGRPDMAMYIFAKNIISGKPIPVFNQGKMKRDFTYVDDIILGIRSSITKDYKNKIFNLGNSQAEPLLDMIQYIEEYLGIKAKINFMEMQKGDIEETLSDISYSTKMLNYNPSVNLKDGIGRFLEWFKIYHNI
tara:strand:- start:607 stop:1569 length:963 start_codon:yes stop_codon:yes gene_type:complete